MAFWVYILRCSDGSYYTGHTDNLEHRLAQHHAGEILGCYTLDRRPLTLVFSQDLPDRVSALEAEQRIKRWSRAKKEALATSNWDELSQLARRRTKRGSIAAVSIGRSATASTSAPHHERDDSIAAVSIGRSATASTSAPHHERDDSIAAVSIGRSATASASAPHHERIGLANPADRSDEDSPVRGEEPWFDPPSRSMAAPSPRKGPHHDREVAHSANETASRTTFDEHWMRHALALAERAETEFDEIPVGAVLISADGDILGEGFNRTICDHDPSAHAEIVALRAAGQRLQNYRLPGTTLYVTLEPCAMCAMALVHARVSRVVYAAADPKTGAAGSVFDLITDPRHNHRIEIASGVLAEEAGQRLSDYFRRKRQAARER